MKVVEIVSFEAATGISDADMLAAMKRTEAFLHTQPGCLMALLSKGEDGRWREIVLWRDMETAQAGSKAFEAQDFLPEVMAVIKADSLTLHHEPVQWEMAARERLQWG
ncbi:hypothetical protein [Tritonibacter aquimaris]|nr:hypothetical protein [Tritonibacter aquimaris]